MLKGFRFCNDAVLFFCYHCNINCLFWTWCKYLWNSQFSYFTYKELLSIKTVDLWKYPKHYLYVIYNVFSVMSVLCQEETLTLLDIWFRSMLREKEEIWLSPMTEALTPTEKSKKQRDNTKNATKNFDYTTIADRLRTVSWGNDSHPAGVVKPVYGRHFSSPEPNALIGWYIFVFFSETAGRNSTKLDRKRSQHHLPRVYFSGRS